MIRRWIPPDAVLLGTALLVAGALLVVAAGAAGPDDGGLPGLPGLGRATDLSRCPAAFDPRLGADCALRYGPIPATDPLCPDHALPGLEGRR